MKLPQRFEVKPKNTRNIILLIILYGFFVLVGFFIILTGDALEIFWGILLIPYFGGAALFHIPKLACRPVSMILTYDGLYQISPYGVVKLLWQDVESIGIAKVSKRKYVGLRLQTYDQYINNCPPQAAEFITTFLPHLKFAEFITKFLPYLKFLAVTASFVPTPTSVKLWSALEGRENPAKILKSFGKVGTMVQGMLWSRENCGYDILFFWTDLDRSAAEFVQLLEQYRRVARGNNEK